jgi:hypothetical protein
MSYGMALFNPSNYTRTGYVSVPWQPIYERTRIPPEAFLIRDHSHDYLRFQIDRIDPNDPSLDTLVFSYDKPLNPGPDDYSKSSTFLNIESGESPSLKEGKSRVTLNNENPSQSVQLTNGRLYVWLNLLPNVPQDKKKNWYAGCATSVRLEDNELLDSYRGKIPGVGHDPEKRCMQISAIELLRAPWETTEYYWVRLFDQPYRIVAHSNGCLRASLTIASDPFQFPYWDPFARKIRNLTCSLYRVLSVYPEKDFIMEELFIKATPSRENKSEGNITASLNPTFRAHYFALMDLSWEPQIYQSPTVPDWFAVGATNNWPPCPSYGFATDVHASPLIHPVPDYPDKLLAYKSYSWHLLPAKTARSLHLFMNNEPSELGRAGHCWYENCYKPLKAILIGGD